LVLSVTGVQVADVKASDLEEGWFRMERRLAREPEAFRFPWQPVEVLQRGCDLLPQEKRRLLRGGGRSGADQHRVVKL
jgi:hypothetical protein